MSTENSNTTQPCTIDSVKVRLLTDRKRYKGEPEKKCFYTASDKIKRVDVLLDALENLEDYLNDTKHNAP